MSWGSVRSKLWPPLLGSGTYIVVPSPEELVVHPTLSITLASTLDITIGRALLASFLLYRALGGGMVGAALLLGGRRAVFRMKGMVRTMSLIARLVASRFLR